MLIKLVNHNVLVNGILYNFSPDSVWKAVVNLADAVNYYAGISHYVFHSSPLPNSEHTQDLVDIEYQITQERWRMFKRRTKHSKVWEFALHHLIPISGFPSVFL